jgi:hypothetical protein
MTIDGKVKAPILSDVMLVEVNTDFGQPIETYVKS